MLNTFSLSSVFRVANSVGAFQVASIVGMNHVGNAKDQKHKKPAEVPPHDRLLV
jgi:hypothetical protein